MKLSIALLSIGALCLSSVKALTKSHKYDYESPCAEDDVKCWDNLGEDCD
jgi:hypothetical protein